jgi:hypothetical protein
MATISGLFMVVMAIGMAAMWTVDIAKSPEIDRGGGLLRARDRAGSVMLPHWTAEYATALLLVVGGVGLLLGLQAGPWSWAVPLGVGALAYTSLNSLSWVLAERGRAVYGVPMVIGLVGSVAVIVLMLTGSVTLFGG